MRTQPDLMLGMEIAAATFFVGFALGFLVWAAVDIYRWWKGRNPQAADKGEARASFSWGALAILMAAVACIAALRSIR